MHLFIWAKLENDPGEFFSCVHRWPHRPKWEEKKKLRLEEKTTYFYFSTFLKISDVARCSAEQTLQVSRKQLPDLAMLYLVG